MPILVCIMNLCDKDNTTKIEAAEFFRCSTRTIDRWIDEGRLNAFRGPGRRILIPTEELTIRLRPANMCPPGGTKG